jgi:hypothetical protein
MNGLRRTQIQKVASRFSSSSGQSLWSAPR